MDINEENWFIWLIALLIALFIQYAIIRLAVSHALDGIGVTLRHIFRLKKEELKMKGIDEVQLRLVTDLQEEREELEKKYGSGSLTEYQYEQMKKALEQKFKN